jgi:anthranilate synthase component 2
MKPEGIILSPGPGRPEDAGVCIDLVKRLGPSYPLLGVCLGHQAICTAYGAVVSYAKELMHGKVSECGIDPACPLFAGLDSRIRVGRYHSLAALEETMPECLKVTARTGDGEIMAVKHAEYDVYGVQFHPESILTPDGEKILRNFIDITGKSRQ